MARTVIETIRDDRLVERSAALGERWSQQLRSLAVGGGISEVRGLGLMIGLEMGEDAKRFQEHAFKEKVLVNVAGGRTVRMVPPLIISDASVARTNEVLGTFLGR